MANFVLIHGSWHGAWCWYQIVPRLLAVGHRAVAPDMPAHGRDWRTHKEVTLEDYVTRAAEAIRSQPGPTIVVAHSRGGIVASRLAELYPERVAKLVYLAAFLLPDGHRVLEYAQQDSGSRVRDNLDVNAEQGWDMLRRDAFREVLYEDCSDADIALCESLLTPEPLAPTLTPLKLSAERYGRVPRVYIELTRDRAVSPALQRRMYTAMPCETVMRIDSSHSAYFSAPDELASRLDSLH